MLRKCRQIGLEPVDDAVLLIIGNVGNERRLFNHAPHAIPLARQLRQRTVAGAVAGGLAERSISPRNDQSAISSRIRSMSIRSKDRASRGCSASRAFADDKRRRTRERHLRTCCRPSRSGDRLPRCWSLVSRDPLPRPGMRFVEVIQVEDEIALGEA